MSEPIRRSLDAQIQEIETSRREIGAKHRLDVGKGQMTAADAEYRRDTLLAIQRTLEWLKEWEPVVRGAINEAKGNSDGGQKHAADQLEDGR